MSLGFTRAREWAVNALRTLVSTRTGRPAVGWGDWLEPFEPSSINALENPE
jgi:hypothetical protein